MLLEAKGTPLARAMLCMRYYDELNHLFRAPGRHEAALGKFESSQGRSPAQHQIELAVELLCVQGKGEGKLG